MSSVPCSKTQNVLFFFLVKNYTHPTDVCQVSPSDIGLPTASWHSDLQTEPCLPEPLSSLYNHMGPLLIYLFRQQCLSCSNALRAGGRICISMSFISTPGYWTILSFLLPLPQISISKLPVWSSTYR